LIVKDLMQSPVMVVKSMNTIAHARNLMLKEKVSRLIVVEGEMPVGTLTRRDIIRSLRNYKMRKREFESIIVNEVMRTPVITLFEDDSITDAARKMVSNNIKGLPVVDRKGKLVGIITKTDFTRYFSENFQGRFKVKEIAQRKDGIPVIHSSHTAFHAMDIMEETSTDRIIVIDDSKPIGIITETDLSFMQQQKSGDSFRKGNRKEIETISPTRIYLLPTAADVMTVDPIVINESKDAAIAAGTLIRDDIGGMPVVNKKGDLVGMITKFDIVKVLAKEA
jgi:CBS domain-containing protein